MKKYYSCWELQYKLSLLILNHIAPVKDPGHIQKLLEELCITLERIEKGAETWNRTGPAKRTQAINL